MGRRPPPPCKRKSCARTRLSLAKSLFDSLPKRTYTLLGEGKEWEVQGLPFRLGFEGHDSITRLSRSSFHGKGTVGAMIS
jgi:hypothetical protein